MQYKINYKYIILGVFFFILYFITSYKIFPIGMDEVWNYGFGYNIINGVVPYRDFNMIVTPLYQYLLAIFLFIFGKKICTLYILNSLIATLITLICYKRLDKKVLLLIPMIVLFNYTCYNLLSVLILIIILEVLDTKSKYKDFWIGLLVSLLILTKQTVGGLVLISAFIYSKNIKQFVIGFLPLCIVFFLYLLFTNSIYLFFDYCLFGLFDFSSGNGLSNVMIIVLILYLIALCLMIYLIIKQKFKDQKLLLVLMFQIMAFPILDPSHIIPAVFPFVFYLLDNLNGYKKREQYIGMLIIFYFFIIPFGDYYNFFKDYNNYIIYDNKDSFLYGKSISVDIDKNLYIKKILDDKYSNYKAFYLNEYAYLIKLRNNEILNKFDIINNGNMGYNGEKKYVREIENKCRDTSCVFVLPNFKDLGQTNKYILDFIDKRYIYKEKSGVFTIYVNK